MKKLILIVMLLIGTISCSDWADSKIKGNYTNPRAKDIIIITIAVIAAVAIMGGPSNNNNKNINYV